MRRALRTSEYTFGGSGRFQVEKEASVTFDFKREYKEFYLPKGKPALVTVPPMTYVAVRGAGDPNEEGGAYQKAIGVLYAIA